MSSPARMSQPTTLRTTRDSDLSDKDAVFTAAGFFPAACDGHFAQHVHAHAVGADTGRDRNRDSRITGTAEDMARQRIGPFSKAAWAASVPIFFCRTVCGFMDSLLYCDWRAFAGRPSTDGVVRWAAEMLCIDRTETG